MTGEKISKKAIPQGPPKGNVIVIGNSRVGKSTLINAVLGENKTEIGAGIEGTTKELHIYENQYVSFRLIDTIGFEPNLFKRTHAILKVKEWSRDCARAGREDRQQSEIPGTVGERNRVKGNRRRSYSHVSDHAAL